VRRTQLTVKGVIVIMLLAPDLTKTERDRLIEKCPPQQRPLFAGWLNGTHELNGDPIEPSSQAGGIEVTER